MDHDIRTKGAIFHICEGSAGTCKLRKPRRDPRELIHLDRWRLLSPHTMMLSKYTEPLGLQLGREALRQKAQEKAAAVPPVGLGGTGLDDALQRQLQQRPSGTDGDVAGLDAPGHKQPKGEREKDRKKRQNLEEQLYSNVERRKEQERSRSRRKKKGKKRKGLSKVEQELQKKGQYISSGSSSSGEETSSDSPFQSPSSRGGELWRVAQKKPGKLTERSLAEMTRYLAERSETGGGGLQWQGQKVLAYLSQVVLVNHPPR